MPYFATSDLPAAVRRLPPHAQEIFLSAFNNAWQSYAAHGSREPEGIAFRVAWAAVKKRYRNQGGGWMAKDSQRTAD